MPLGSSSAAPVMTPGPSRLNRPLKRSLPVPSAAESIDDGITPLPADQSRSDLDAGRRLAALVLGGFEQTPDAVHGCEIMPLLGDLLGRQIALDQPFQDGVELGVG